MCKYLFFIGYNLTCLILHVSIFCYPVRHSCCTSSVSLIFHILGWSLGPVDHVNKCINPFSLFYSSLEANHRKLTFSSNRGVWVLKICLWIHVIVELNGEDVREGHKDWLLHKNSDNKVNAGENKTPDIIMRSSSVLF